MGSLPTSATMWWLVVSPHLPHQASISPPTVSPPVGTARPWLQETPVIRRSPTVDDARDPVGRAVGRDRRDLGQQRRQPLDVDHAPAQRAVDLHLLARRQRRVHLAVSPPEPLDPFLRGDDQIPLLFPFLRGVNLERHVAQLVGDLVYGWHVLRVGHCFPRLRGNCNGLRAPVWGAGQGHSRTVASLVVCGTCSALLGPRGCLGRRSDSGSGRRLWRSASRRRAPPRKAGRRTSRCLRACRRIARRRRPRRRRHRRLPPAVTAAARGAPVRRRRLRRAAHQRERLAGAGRRGHRRRRRRAPIPPWDGPSPDSYLPTLAGPIGLYRISTAEVGPTNHLRLALHGEFFQSSSFLVDKDTDRRLLGDFTFGYTVHRERRALRRAADRQQPQHARGRDRSPRPGADQVVRRSGARRQGADAARARRQRRLRARAQVPVVGVGPVVLRRARRRCGSGRSSRSTCAASATAARRCACTPTSTTTSTTRPTCTTSPARRSTRRRSRASPTASPPTDSGWDSASMLRSSR